MMKKNGLLWIGGICLVGGFFLLLNQWFNIQWHQMRSSFVSGLPYILPITLMVIGAGLMTRHINNKD